MGPTADVRGAVLPLLSPMQTPLSALRGCCVQPVELSSCGRAMPRRHRRTPAAGGRNAATPRSLLAEAEDEAEAGTEGAGEALLEAAAAVTRACSVACTWPCGTPRAAPMTRACGGAGKPMDRHVT